MCCQHTSLACDTLIKLKKVTNIQDIKIEYSMLLALSVVLIVSSSFVCPTPLDRVHEKTVT